MTPKPLDCRTAQNWIPDLVSGDLSQEQRRELDVHMVNCEVCAEVLNQYLFADTEDGEALDSEEVTMILARTSGSACPLAHHMIFDDDTGANDRTLLNDHIVHCPQCRALSETWEWVNPTLESMAVLNPGPEFLDNVLEKTSGRSVTAPLGHRIREWWKGLGDLIVTRPRFALEFSYIATLILVLVFGPLRVPMQMVEEHTSVINRAGMISTIYDDGVRSVLSATQDTWLSGSLWSSHRFNAFKAGYHRFKVRISPPLTDMKKHGQALKDSIKKRDINRAVPALHGIWVNCRRAWNAVRSDPAEGDNNGKSNHPSD